MVWATSFALRRIMLQVPHPTSANKAFTSSTTKAKWEKGYSSFNSWTVFEESFSMELTYNWSYRANTSPSLIDINSIVSTSQLASRFITHASRTQPDSFLITLPRLTKPSPTLTAASVLSLTIPNPGYIHLGTAHLGVVSCSIALATLANWNSSNRHCDLSSRLRELRMNSPCNTEFLFIPDAW